MNDITVLAEREKFEAWAEKAGELLWGRLKNQRNTSGGYSLQVYTRMWKAWQAANAEMVEALEKAQRRIAELEGSLGVLEEVYISTADEVSELESRTVTVKMPARCACEGYHIGEAYLVEDPDGDCYDRDEVLEALAAAGIQVIEGEGQ